MLQQSCISSLQLTWNRINIQYGTQYFAQYAETIDPPQETYNELSAIAKVPPLQPTANVPGQQNLPYRRFNPRKER